MLTLGHRSAPPSPERLESPRKAPVTRLKLPDVRVSRPMRVRWPRPALTHRSAWKALCYPDFRLYFIGSLTSNLGTWMQTTAQVILVYRLTHSVFAVGFVTSAQFAPSLFLGPWATALVASRFGGKWMLIAIQAASACIAGLLTLLVATNSLTEAAMAMNSVSYNSGRALAPILSVVVIATIGFKWAFAFNAMSFVIFAITLWFVRARDAGQTAQRASITDGYRAAVDKPRILLLLAIVAAVTFADDPVLILGPALAGQLHASNSWPGYFLSALGLGTVIGSLRPARASGNWQDSWPANRMAAWLLPLPTRDATHREESWNSRRAAAWLLVLSACVITFALGIGTWVSLAAAFAAGFAALNTGAVTQTQLARLRPGYAAGVMALWAVCWAGTKPLASLADGWLASHTHWLWFPAVVLNLFALILVLAEFCLPAALRERFRERFRERLKHMLPATSAVPNRETPPQQAQDDRQCAPA